MFFSHHARGSAEYVAYLITLLYGLPISGFSPASRLIADLGLDDTEPEEFALALAEVGISFSSEAFGRCATVNELVLAVNTAASSKNSG